MTIQPFAGQGIGNQWSLELPVTNFNYNFKTRSWGSVPLGARIGRTTSLSKLPVRLFVDAEYTRVDGGVASQ